MRDPSVCLFDVQKAEVLQIGILAADIQQCEHLLIIETSFGFSMRYRQSCRGGF